MLSQRLNDGEYGSSSPAVRRATREEHPSRYLGLSPARPAINIKGIGGIGLSEDRPREGSKKEALANFMMKNSPQKPPSDLQDPFRPESYKSPPSSRRG